VGLILRRWSAGIRRIWWSGWREGRQEAEFVDWSLRQTADWSISNRIEI